MKPNENVFFRNQSGIYQIENEQIDLAAMPFEFGLSEGVLEQSKVCGIFSYLIGHFLKPNPPNISDLSSFLLTNGSLLVYTLCAYLSIALLGSLVPRLVHPNFDRLSSLKLALLKTPFLDLNRIAHVSFRFGLLVLCFTWFLFFMQNFLSGTIKTEKVVLKTDELIDSPFKALASEKTMIIPFDQLEMIATAPESSFIRSLHTKKRFLFTGEMGKTKWSLFFERPIDSYFVFGSDVHAIFALAALAPSANSLDMFAFVQPERSYFDAMNVFYMRRSLDENRKRFIHRR